EREHDERTGETSRAPTFKIECGARTVDDPSHGKKAERLEERRKGLCGIDPPGRGHTEDRGCENGHQQSDLSEAGEQGERDLTEGDGSDDRNRERCPD